MATCYVVVGETGEYSCYSLWYVKAFMDRERAVAACEELNEWCRLNSCDKKANKHVGQLSHRKVMPPGDPQFRNDYTGTQYGVLEVPME